MEDMKILTLNAWGMLYLSADIDVRMAALSEELAKGEFSIVLLQEIWSQRHYAMIKEKVKDVLPYSHYFYSGYIGSGCATFSAFPIVDTFFHGYTHNGHCWDVLHGDWFAGKGAGCTVLQHPSCNIYVFNTHLHADYNTQCDDCLEESRTLQNYQLCQFVKQTTRPGDVVIVGGDMNSTPDSIGIKALVELAKLNDTYAIAVTKPNELFTLDRNSNKYVGSDDITSRVDYIFCSSAMECSSANLALQKIPNTDLHFSDHEGYTATLRLKGETAHCSSNAVNGPAAIELLQRFHASMLKGERLSDIVHWRKVAFVIVLFTIIIVMPLLSVVELPSPCSCWGKCVVLLQFVVVVCCAVYFWLLMYVRVTDRRAFRNVVTEIEVKMDALHRLTSDKKEQ